MVNSVNPLKSRVNIVTTFLPHYWIAPSRKMMQCPMGFWYNLSMRKTNPKTLKADWNAIKPRPIYQFVSTAELAKVLGVKHQVVANFALRGILPEPVPRAKYLKGNKRYYRISAIKAWLQSQPELEIYRQFLDDEFGEGYIFDVEYAMNMLHENPYMAIRN